MRNFNLIIFLSALLTLPFMGFVWQNSRMAKVKFDSIPTKGQSKNEHTSYLKNGLKVSLSPFKPVQTQTSAIKNSTSKFDDDKLLTDVIIYPNPITDKVNLSYTVKKNANVSIKIMDVLGNDVLTLMAQHVEAGEQKNTFQISNRLSSGFYFIRMIVGTESVIKRISVL